MTRLYLDSTLFTSHLDARYCDIPGKMNGTKSKPPNILFILADDLVRGTNFKVDEDIEHLLFL